MKKLLLFLFLSSWAFAQTSVQKVTGSDAVANNLACQTVADGTCVPMQSAVLGWNGTSWVRIPATISGLSVVLSGTNPFNLTQVNGQTLGTITTYGTSPGAVLVPAVNAFVTNTLSLAGNLTNNNAAPGSTNLGSLDYLANAANPSWTEGNQVLGSVDLAGNLRVKVNLALPAGGNTIGAVTQASGPWTINLTQLAGGSLGAPSNYGTSPGAVTVPGVNAFVTNTPAVTQSGGPWTVNHTQTAGSTLGALANYGTSPGAVAVESVNAFITNTPAVTIGANSSVNVAQVNGTTTDTNAGAATAGTQRITQAQTTPTDATSNTNVPGIQTYLMGWNTTTWDRIKATGGKLLVTPDSVALPANQSVNISQMNGVTTSMNAGTADTGTQRVVQAQTTPADATSNTSIPGPQVYLMSFNGTTWDRVRSLSGAPGSLQVGANISGSDAQNNANGLGLAGSGVALPLQIWGNLFNNLTWDRARSGASANLPNLIGSQLTANVTVDPCQSSAVLKSSVAINITSATTTQLVAPSGSTAVYVCGFDFTISEVITTANTLQFTAGTGATCAGSTVTKSGLYGAGGVSAAAPIHIQSAGSGMVFQAAASSGVCAVTAIGATGSFQGILSFVQQ